MPIKLNDPDKDREVRFKKKDVKDMVQHHRHYTPVKKLKFANYRLEEIIALLVDNKIIDPTVPLDQQSVNISKYGVKLYPGIHFKAETCTGKPKYIHHSNIIICNTVKNSSDEFEDMLDDNKLTDNHSIVIDSDPYGDGLDMGQICPPECMQPDEERYDIGYDN